MCGPMTERKEWTAELTEEHVLSRAVRHLVLQVEAPADFHWLPGQHVELFSAAEPGRRFAYSVASAELSTVPGRFELAVGRDGSARAVDALRVGDRIRVSEPRGSFVREGASARDAVFIGVGTGVSPLRAMIASALLRPPPGPDLTLLFGCRSEDELLWGRELSGWAEQRRFRFWPTLSRPSAAWQGRTGYVQSHLGAFGPELALAEFFVCGSRAMVDEVATRLGELGVSPDRLKLEGY